jgi:hypothetical protein
MPKKETGNEENPADEKVHVKQSPPQETGEDKWRADENQGRERNHKTSGEGQITPETKYQTAQKWIEDNENGCHPRCGVMVHVFGRKSREFGCLGRRFWNHGYGHRLHCPY